MRLAFFYLFHKFLIFYLCIPFGGDGSEENETYVNKLLGSLLFMPPYDIESQGFSIDAEIFLKVTRLMLPFHSSCINLNQSF